MKFNVSIWWVILAFLIATCLAFFVGCYFYTGQLSKQKNTYENQIQLIRSQKDSIIKQNYLRIHLLEKTISGVDESIARYETTLEELSKRKTQVKVVYRDRYRELETVSDSAIIDYWKNRFNEE